MESWAWPLIGLIFTLICALVGVIYRHGQNRDDKQDARFDKGEEKLSDHIKDDVAAHERIRAVETEIENMKVEVRSLRERWHDLRGDVSHSLASWYAELVDRINKK